MKRVLVANRGEIACRIIHAIQDLSMEAVAVYSAADKDALHVKIADASICIGGSASKDSYLNISRIIAAAEITGADAVHPGYGFLSENASFAEIVEKSGLTFIGPDSTTIYRLGNKIEAKKLALLSGCPVIPGTEGGVESLEEGISLARTIGYPIFIKAAAGGGGKGIRIARNEKDFKEAFISAKREAMLSFNDDSIYLEKMIVNPKHIEVQIAADIHGNIIHLYERDCTLQRRRQKLIEETPSLSIDSGQREKICNAALRLLQKANYHSLGTVEFLLDEQGNFYFMEVNTRVQVEHTITEELLGIDLVDMQIKIALGQKLEIKQKDIFLGPLHVMEFRINAEDPDQNFRPCPGNLEVFIPPLGAHVRVDTAVHQGAIISPFYDSMIAKLIVTGKNRNEVITRARRMLAAFYIEGVATTIPFYSKILLEDFFMNNDHHILTIDEKTKEGAIQ
ncbi:MAG: Biotin carboxylase [Chlamydiia bacterium]|nr:Biotin carboxylase [Chlamydiia bacterium]MCH9624803.1 Biotin carboxylase [Chlamydiia bacterium]